MSSALCLAMFHAWIHEEQHIYEGRQLKKTTGPLAHLEEMSQQLASGSCSGADAVPLSFAVEI